jgi:hypothetical protein
MLRWPIVFALLATPFGGEASAIRMWQVKDAAAAPLIVTARVVSLETYERGEMTADVEVLRAFPDRDRQLVGSRLRIRYLTYGPGIGGGGNGSPLPVFEPGQVRIFPLQANANPLSEPSRLIGDRGFGLTIPALAVLREADDPPASGRAFVMREIASGLATGTPRDIAAVSTYLRDQFDNLAPELLPLLRVAIGNDRERWAGVATGTLSAEGIPRSGVAELMGEKAPMRESQRLERAALQQLNASPETDSLLIHTWIANAAVNDWGAGVALMEFGDNPVTTETLRKALSDDAAGSSYIAWTLVRNGHTAVLPDALAHALQVVDRLPAVDYGDVQGAVELLLDFGSDQQVRQLAGVVAKYQLQNREHYQILWRFATDFNNPREGRVVAVVLRDRNPFSGLDMRVCDYAVGLLERAVGQKFATGGKTLVERDEAVSRAMAWLAMNGLAN